MPTSSLSFAMTSPLEALVRKSPLSVTPDTPVREALRVMEREAIGSMLVAEPVNKVPLGIVTLRDVLRWMCTDGFDAMQPIRQVMTPNPMCMSHRATAFQATLAMAQRRVRHVVVVDDRGQIFGVVSQNDLYNLQRYGLKELTHEFASAGSVAELQGGVKRVRELAASMLARGASAEVLAQLVSTLHDVLTVRIIELTQGDFKLPEVPWCWLALGSEGRVEQTFFSDQDNGIIFEARDAHEADLIATALLPFAKAVNQHLDACGLPLCEGGIMAGNPQWCLSLAQWQDKFASWMHHPQPEALLNATIFFDFRAIHGEAALCERLRAWLVGAAPHERSFLRMMASNALDVRAPLGWAWLGSGFRYETGATPPRSIDLKKHGTRLFVDAARILALANGSVQTNTAQRLRDLAARGLLSSSMAEAVIEAFHHTQLHRMRNQCDSANQAHPNLLLPDRLNELERQTLRFSLKLSEKLQLKLKVDYQL